MNQNHLYSRKTNKHNSMFFQYRLLRNIHKIRNIRKSLQCQKNPPFPPLHGRVGFEETEAEREAEAEREEAAEAETTEEAAEAAEAEAEEAAEAETEANFIIGFFIFERTMTTPTATRIRKNPMISFMYGTTKSKEISSCDFGSIIACHDLSM
jgi:hypothetical protein